MCGRFTIAKKAEDLVDAFGVHFPEDFKFSPRYNIAATQKVPVICCDQPGVFSPLSWGYNAPIEHKIKLIINARIETISEKAIFRTRIENHRCIIPADGFYEWTKQNKPHQPFYIKEKNHNLFGFAGFYFDLNKTDKAFVIITTEANEKIKPIHDRMPVMLSPKNIDNWINPDSNIITAVDLISKNTLTSEELDVYPVGTKVNNVKFEDPTLINKVSLQQTSLWDD